MPQVEYEQLESRRMLSAGPRQMEFLDRGVVATRASSSSVFVSWRSLALDPTSMTFNVYRATNGGAATKLNSSSLAGGTNYTDTTANNSAAAYSYFVKPVINGVEQAASPSFTVSANSASGPLIQIPLRNIGNYSITHISVADLDGDGKYDYIVDRTPPSVNEVSTQPDIIEAYKSDGTFLWSVSAGPNSFDQDNIEPGSTTIDVGNWDGVTAYDMDGDGKAEVLYRTANGVVFGDGKTLSYPSNNDVQFISVIDGVTGAEKARIQIPSDFLSDGPLAASFGIGYLDGVHPSLVAKLKNRIGSGDFNQMFVAWDYNGTQLTQKWKYITAPVDSDNGHNIRIVDVNGDGKDDVADTAQVINSDGTLLYNMRYGTPSIGHGDRFFIGDLDPDRPGLEGYGIQQNNPSFMTEYYYDAGTGQVLHSHYLTSLNDNGRGETGDIDPNYPGYEYWSFYGLWNSHTPAPGQAPVETEINSDPSRPYPYPNFRVWWDGDVGSENLNDTVIDKWNPTTQTTGRVTTLYHYGSPTSAARSAPIFYGDILGDWREEVIFENSDHLALDIYTTQIPSSTRIYTLAENPEYRNSMTTKGYYQSNMVDYFLGYGMTTPPTPNIQVLSGGSDSSATPTVVNPATASASTITGKTVDLSVLGADDGGEANLTYTWEATGGNPTGAGVSFSANGTNAAKNTTASFSAVGIYTLIATIRDAGGKTITSSVVVRVNQVLSGVSVNPANPTVTVGTTQQFSASGIDQFGNPMASSLTFGWLVTSGGGSINSAGVFTAPSVAGATSVQAQAGSFYGSASVAIAAIADVYQAESASFGGGVSIDTNASGYDGTGFANFPGNGGFVQWNNVDGGAGGATNILFRYALATGTRTGRVTVNGIAQPVVMPATGSFNSWTTVSVPVTLNAGANNTIKLESTGQDLGNTDELQVQRGPGFNLAPTIASPAKSSSNPVLGTTANLSVLGADDGGEAALVYTWAASGPAAVSFSANGTNAAKDTTATFTAPGTYTLAVSLRDASGLGTASSVVVNVLIAQTLPAPRAWYKLDESSGANVSDSSGNANNGTAVNGPAWTSGITGNALSFDGIDDYVNLPNSLVSTSAGSVSMWVKTNANFTDSAMLFYTSSTTTGNGGGAENELHLNFLSTKQIQFFIEGGSSNDVNLTSPATYADNLWHPVAATWDVNGDATLYVDGVPVASAVDNSSSFTGSAVTRLGRPGTSVRYYSGLMDDVRLYNVALTAPQVQALSDVIPPTVTHSSFVADSAPNFLRFAFSEPVVIDQPLSSLIITRSGGGSITPTNMDYGPATNSAAFELSTPLPDGIYTASFAAGTVRDLAGNELASPFSYSFSFLAGDANGDGTVNALDFNILASHFGRSSPTFSSGDFNYDHAVDTADFVILATQFGRRIEIQSNAAARRILDLFATSPIDRSSATRAILK